MAVGGFSRGRRWLGAAEGLGTAVVVLLVVAVLTYAATRPTLRRRLDLTQGAQFTLTDQTRQVLAALPHPVRADLLMRPEIGAAPNGLYEVQARAIQYVDGLLREYEIASRGRLLVRRLNPDSDRLEAEALARELALTRYNVLVLTGGERHHVVRLEDMVTIDRGYAGEKIEPAQLIELRGEAPLTAALLDVGQDKPPRVGFLRGLGGPSPDDQDNFSLFLFREQIRGQGLQPENVDLLTSEHIPADLDALVVWGPELPLGRRVREEILAWNAKGGALLIGVDPLHEDPDLDAVLAALGLDRERRILCLDDSPVAQGARRSQITVTRFSASQEISAPIAKQGIFANVYSAGGLGRRGDAPAGTSCEPLLTAPEACFGDIPSEPGKPGDYTLGDNEVRGPRVLGYAVTGKGGRAVVFGASSIFTTTFLLSSEGGSANLDLGLNSINWLVRREHSIGARPRQVYESRVDLTPDEHQHVLVYVVVLMPLGGVALGLLVWLARRR